MDAAIEVFKREAAEAALAHVQSGMIVGLGHGSTAIWAVRGLAQRLASGELSEVRGVPCSRAVAAEARNLGIPLTTLEEYPTVDVTIDGADEVDPQLNLIKGGGGALLREKIVAQASRREIIVVSADKLSSHLGERWKVPVEVAPFGWRTQIAYLEALGAVVRRRHDQSNEPQVTDQGNYILDADFGPLLEPARLAAQLCERAGIVEHGLFLELATDVIVAGPTGVEHLRRG